MEASHPFAFDKIFGPNSRQDNVFNEVALPVIKGNFITSSQAFFKDIMALYSPTDRLLAAKPLQWR